MINLTTEQEASLSYILKNYGEEPQLRQLQEEAAELIAATNHYIRDPNGKTRYQLTEELADTIIMIAQASQLINEDRLMEIIRDKIRRQLGRIESQKQQNTK